MIDVHILGVMQDGGLPQAGCRCSHCRQALAGEIPPHWTASLGLLKPEANRWYLIDATPDLPQQVAWMQHIAPEAELAGILITHAHMGHYTGLLHLGLEGWNTHRVPVWGDARLCELLQQNAPWSQLIAQENIVLQPVAPFQPLILDDNLRITPIPVPHRNEWSEMLAFFIETHAQTLFYCPDADRWDGWDPPLESHLRTADLALLDGTFFQPDEIPHRNPAKVPHPFVKEAIERLQPYAERILFTHLNHTNPLLHAGPERRQVEGLGFRIAVQGQHFRMV